MNRFTGRFTTYRKTIALPNWNTRLKFIPFGDIHRHSPGCDVDRWHQFLARSKADDDEYTYYLGLGDYDDLASTTERAVLSDPRLHEATVAQLDQYNAGLVEEFKGEIEFMRGRLIGLMEGHHFWLFQSGITSTHLLAQEMACRYLGNVCYVRLSVGVKGTNCSIRIDIVAAHGKGSGGKLLGTSINQVDDLCRIFPNADIYLMGHNHQKSAVSKTVLEVEKTRKPEMAVKQKRQWLCRTGSFLKGYIEDEESYIVRGLYRPADLGVVRGEIEFRKTNEVLSKDIHFWS